MKSAKKVLALLLVVIALFSVMTVSVSAADAAASVEFSGKIVEQITMLGEWLAGAAAFLGRIAIEPIVWVVSLFVNVNI